MEPRNEGEENNAGANWITSDKKVKFEDFDLHSIERMKKRKTPKMMQWAIKYSRGYIKDEKQASYLLLAFAAVVVSISFFLFFFYGKISNPKNAPIIFYSKNGPSRLEPTLQK